MYGIMGPFGLRLMTPTVVWVELLSAPIALLGNFFGRRDIVLGSITAICSLHLGIALTVRNTYLLSSVACCAWMIFLPHPIISDGATAGLDDSNDNDRNRDGVKHVQEDKSSDHERSKKGRWTSVVASILIISFISSSVWFETISEECNQSMKHIWSTLLHNRWNVFIGAEEYVTWEIAPGRLADGTIVDVWGGSTDGVDWDMPGTGAPCTSTSRPGRWRSFPYLAGLEGKEGEVLWEYLCTQWNQEHGVGIMNLSSNDNDTNGSARRLLRFNFFMLQADVLPNMGFSATRKRLIHSHECTYREERITGNGVLEHGGEF